MAALRNAARFCGPCPSFTWHLSSPNVTSRKRVQALNTPMALPAGHQQGRAGALAREAADRVLHLDRVLILGVRGAFQAADLLQAGPVKMFGQAGAGLEMPLYSRPCPLLEARDSESDCRRWRSVAGGKSGLEFSLDRGFQLGLVAFDNEQILAVVLDNLLAQLALAEYRVARDQAAFEHDRFEQVERGFGFVRAGVHCWLA
jgi:hypothetical protein